MTWPNLALPINGVQNDPNLGASIPHHSIPDTIGLGLMG